ncbi:MAG: sigma-70 family RNA polymerase sigma factor [Chloroflexi bacterium]|nr:sigma-70 family RNA polymerase sigma factor [Chloroflexota bacterium]
MQDEERIVRRAQEGDEAAFTMLYEEHFDKVYRYMALRVRDRSEAEDLAQQVFAKAFEALGTFKWRGAPFAAWLFRIARNQVVDWQRKAGKQSTTSIENVTVLSEENIEDRVENKLALQAVVEASKHLTPAQRDVLALRFGAEMSIMETARVMGKNEGAIKALQHSAVNALRRILSQGKHEH